jgi:hypothetical protein
VVFFATAQHGFAEKVVEADMSDADLILTWLQPGG